jgi:hypothetical protein
LVTQHPHIRATVNEFRLKDGQVVPLGDINLKSGGINRTRDGVAEGITRELGAFVAGGELNVCFEECTNHQGLVNRWLNHTMRELVDPCKWIYTRTGRVVIDSYKSDTPRELHAGRHTRRGSRVRQTYGKWDRRGRRFVDGAYTLSDAMIGYTEQAASPNLEHWSGCRCRKCLHYGAPRQGWENSARDGEA